MAKLTDEYGIEVDSRYDTCVKEALFSAAIFLLSAIAILGTVYGLTAGRSPEEYGVVMGMPSYVFWGVIMTHVGFLLALLAGQRLIFRDLSLEPTDPAAGPDNDPAEPAVR